MDLYCSFKRSAVNANEQSYIATFYTIYTIDITYCLQILFWNNSFLENWSQVNLRKTDSLHLIIPLSPSDLVIYQVICMQHAHMCVYMCVCVRVCVCEHLHFDKLHLVIRLSQQLLLCYPSICTIEFWRSAWQYTTIIFFSISALLLGIFVINPPVKSLYKLKQKKGVFKWSKNQLE